MLAVDENPPVLTPGCASIAEVPGPWMIAHVRSRSEKAFAWDVLNSGGHHFLPMVERVMVSGGRKRRVLDILFPAYVFFSCQTDKLFTAPGSQAGRRVTQIIRVPDQDALRKELAGIDSAIRGELQIDPYPHAVVGRRCRVRSGPLMGTEGIVVERPEYTRLILQVSMLGQAITVEIDPALLESA